MPDPRPLGNVARIVIETITALLESNQDEFFEIVANIHTGNVPTAINTLKEAAARNNVFLHALTLLLADKQKSAEEVLISARMRRRKPYDGPNR